MINKRFSCQNIKNLISEETLEKGLELYQNDAVSHVKMDEYEFITGLVRGERDYQTEVKIVSNNLVEFNCDCGSLEPCEHVASLLYYINNVGVNISSYRVNNDDSLEKAKSLIRKFDEKETKDLLIDLLRFNRNLSYVKHKYSDFFISDDIDNYVYQVNELFINYVLNNQIIEGKEDIFLSSIKKFISLATKLVDSNKFSESINLYKLVLNGILQIDTSNLNDYHRNLLEGYSILYYKENFYKFIYHTNDLIELTSSYLEIFYKFLDNEKRLDATRRAYISRFISSLVEVVNLKQSNFEFSSDYYKLLYYKMLFSYEDSKMQVKEICYNNRKNPLIRNLLAKFLVNESQIEKASDLLSDGLNTSDAKEFVMPLLEIYFKYNKSKFHSLLMKAFLEYDKYNYKYYELMKRDEYFKVEDLIEHFKEEYPYEKYPDVYLRILADERKFDDLILALNRVDSFEELRYYNKYLIISHNKEMIELYVSLIQSYYINNGRDEVLDKELEYLKILPNASEYYGLLKEKLV